MSRKEQLLNGGAEERVEQLVEEVIFLEGQLKELKTKPFIMTNPKNPAIQKSTPAAKLYKELLQQYNNSMKLLNRMLGGEDIAEETSPLRKWIEEHR